jgi:geranylgeranyl transferase type-2 subunit beta
MSSSIKSTTTTTNTVSFSQVREKHVQYIVNLDRSEKDTFEYYVTEHLRMNGIYWGLTALDLLKEMNQMDKNAIVQFVLDCQHENGGFGGNKLHDPHLLYTLSAIQILALLDSLDKIDREKVARYMAKMQQPDGSFVGDEFGEVDTRFSYIVLNGLTLLGYHTNDEKSKWINVDLAVDFILKCQNFDGGFGAVPGAESHAGQIFCCVAALAITNQLHRIDQDTLSWWLCERQVEKNGGLNGRPEKLADVCYSWWVLSCLSIMDRLHWISSERLHTFILNCQDDENGGISDKPGNMADVFHTFFGIAGLSLMRVEPNLKTIDPIYALTIETLKKLSIRTPHTNRFSE